LRNIILPGHLPGIQELTINKPLFQELNTLRNLRTDAVTLSIIPILLKLKEVGMPEMLRRLVPGMILDVTRLDGIKSLNEAIKVPDAIFRETAEIKADIDEALGTQDIVRGASAPFSRTSATEITKRLDRAMTRQRARIMRIEDELSEVIPQWFMLAYQFAGPEYLVRAGGADPKSDSLQSYSRHDFIEAIGMDFAFRGATNAINKELQTQQLSELYARAVGTGPIPVMSPLELRNWLKRIYDNTGMRGSNEVFTTEGLGYVTALVQAQLGGGQGETEPPQG